MILWGEVQKMSRSWGKQILSLLNNRNEFEDRQDANKGIWYGNGDEEGAKKGCPGLISQACKGLDL